MSQATHPVAWTAAAVLAVQAFLHLSSTLATTRAGVVINEIVYRPGSGEPEWVELFNPSDSSVDLAGWVLHDRTSARPVITEGSLPSGGYVVVTRDTATLRSRRNPPGPLIELSLPSLNNAGDDIVLRDADGRMVDSVPYRSSWGGSQEGSLERIDHRVGSPEPTNWGSSIDSSGATPGRKNSLAPVGRDLAIERDSFDPDRSIISLTLLNHGTESSYGATLTLYHDLNRDGRGEVYETISGRSVRPMPSGDSSVVELPWPRELTVDGEVALLLLDHPEDEVPENDRRSLLLRLPFADSGLVVNEIMYDPVDDEPEWIELTNRGSRPVEIAGWTVHDAGKSRPVISSGVVAPSDFVVLTSDSALLHTIRPDISRPIIETTLPSFNNGGDLVRLARPDGTTIDSFRYEAVWGGNDGTSLERRGTDLRPVSPASWGSSRDPRGATPGEPNSLLPPEWNLRIESGSFDPAARQIDVVIGSTGRKPGSGAKIVGAVDRDRDDRIGEEEIVLIDTLPTVDSTLSHTLPWTQPIPPSGEELTLFLRSDRDAYPADDTLRLMLRAPSATSGVVITEIDFDPPDGPEWIEVFNTTDRRIDLGGWRVADAAAESRPIDGAVIERGSYLVITPDSTGLVERFGPVTPILTHPLPSLNNGGDILLLRNRDGVTVDSLRYEGDWRGASEGSLERKRIDSSSTDRTNWTGSSDPLGGTPGRANSWRPVQIDLFVADLDVSTEPDERVEILGWIGNRGEGRAGDGTTPAEVRLMLGVDLDRDGRLDEDGKERLDTLAMPTPKQSDSLPFAFPWTRTLTIDGEVALVVVEVEGEERADDNGDTIRVGRRPLDSGVVINEIMFAPEGDEPEWVEIVNRSDDTVELEGWVLHDAGTGRPLLPRHRLAPGRFVVVTSDAATLTEIRPVFSPILETDLPTLNNGGDLVALRSSSGRPVDAVRYRSDWSTLPGTSLERRGVMLRSDDSSSWGSSIDGGGATPGWANSILPAEYDLKLEEVRFDDATSLVRLTLRNVGTGPAEGAEAGLYLDADGDVEAGSDELLRSHQVPRLSSGESIEIEIPWERELRPEGEPALARVWLSEETLTHDNLLPFRPRSPLGTTGVIINEFQAAPIGSEPEWIELMNRSRLPVDLDRWEIADASSTVILTSPVILRSGAFAVVTTDTGLLRSAYEVPENALLIEARLPALNNGGDRITVRNAEGEEIDRLAYGGDWPSRGTGSTERLHPALPTDRPESWALSSDPDGGTPGRINAMLLPDTNLAVDSIRFDRSRRSLSASLANRGAFEPEGGRLQVWRGASLLDTLPLDPLPFGASTTVDYRLPFEPDDVPEQVTIRLVVAGDAVPGDDTASIAVYRTAAETGLIITELMADPQPGDEAPGAEYVEVYNAGDRPVPLAGWSIEEGSGRRSEVGFGTGSGSTAPIISPGSFGVIASDSTLYDPFPGLRDSSGVVIIGADLGLNNGGDRLLLINPSGVVIDSVPYDEGWHDRELIDSRGVALERIDFDRPASDRSAWASSVDRRGGTPAAENSRRLRPADGTDLLELGSEIVSPDGDGYEDFVRIAWHLPFTPATVRITIHDREGRRVAVPVEAERSGPRGDVIWEGRDRAGEPLAIGPYVVRLEAVDTSSGRRLVERRIIVVAAKR